MNSIADALAAGTTSVSLVGIATLDSPPKPSSNGNLGFWLKLRDATYAGGISVGYYRPDAEAVWQSLQGVEIPVVAVRGNVSRKKDLSVFADRLQRVDTSPEPYMPQPAIPVEVSWAEIVAAAGRIESEPLRRVTEHLLQQRDREFRRWAAATSYHEPTLGGLAEHTARMLRAAERDIEEYGAPEPYPSRLRAGVIWHDIGKVLTYGPPPQNQYLPEEDLFSHSLTGCLVLVDLCRSEGLFYKWWQEPDIRALLHMIASHHGQKDWGALVEPRTPEAKALHVIDLYESRRAHSELARREGHPAYDELGV